MQHRIAITALGLLLAAVPASAQTGTGTVARPGLDGGTPPGTMDSARQAVSSIGITLGRDLQAYVLMLQAAERAQRARDGLRAEVARMAEATGSSVPAPPEAGGPQAPVAPRDGAIR